MCNDNGKNAFAVAEVPTGQLNAVVKVIMRQMGILDPFEAIRRINSGEWKVEVDIKPRVWETWKTITIGTGLKTVDQLSNTLSSINMGISATAKDILSKPDFLVSAEKKMIDLVPVTVNALGFVNGAHRKDIYKRAQELGLEICPAEVGPQLRLQFRNQPTENYLFIAMEPISDSDGRSCVFVVAHAYSKNQCIEAVYSGPGDFWASTSTFVFMKKK